MAMMVIVGFFAGNPMNVLLCVPVMSDRTITLFPS